MQALKTMTKNASCTRLLFPSAFKGVLVWTIGVNVVFVKTKMDTSRATSMWRRPYKSCRLVLSHVLANAPNYFQIESCSTQIYLLLRLKSTNLPKARQHH